MRLQNVPQEMHTPDDAAEVLRQADKLTRSGASTAERRRRTDSEPTT